MTRNYGIENLDEWPAAILPHSVRRRRAVRRMFLILCGVAVVIGALIAVNH